MWIASAGGIVKIEGIARKSLTGISTIPAPVLTTPVRAVIVLGNDTVLAGTIGQGLLLLDQAGLVLSRFTSENSGLTLG